MNLVEKLIDKSKYKLKCPYEMKPEYITIHNTSNKASADNEVKYMQGNNTEVGFHIAVDDVKAIIAIPLDRNAWHSGDGNGDGNRKSIGIEICYSTGDEAKFKKAELQAIEVVLYLMDKYNIPLENVRSHKSWSGKNCPHKTDMAWFLAQVKLKLDKVNNSTTQDDDLIQAILVLNKRGVISNPEMWNDVSKMDMKYAESLIQKLALSMINYQDCVEILKSHEIILDDKLWLDKKYNPNHMRSLIIKSSKK